MKASGADCQTLIPAFGQPVVWLTLCFAWAVQFPSLPHPLECHILQVSALSWVERPLVSLCHKQGTPAVI